MHSKDIMKNSNIQNNAIEECFLREKKTVYHKKPSENVPALRTGNIGCVLLRGASLKSSYETRSRGSFAASLNPIFGAANAGLLSR